MPSGGAKRAAGDDNEEFAVSPETCKVVALARQRSTTEDRRRARVLSRLKEQAMAVRESVFERSDSCARPTCSHAVAGCCPCQARITDSPPAFQRPKQVEAYGWAEVRRPQRCVPVRQREEVQEMPSGQGTASSPAKGICFSKPTPDLDQNRGTTGRNPQKQSSHSGSVGYDRGSNRGGGQHQPDQ